MKKTHGAHLRLCAHALLGSSVVIQGVQPLYEQNTLRMKQSQLNFILRAQIK